MGLVSSSPHSLLQGRRFLAVLSLAIAGFSLGLSAQDAAVVVVDDSPTAEQLLEQAEDQAANNPAESARLICRVLDEFGRKLVRLPGCTDRFVDGRARSESFLREHKGVLDCFRSAQSGEADRLAEAGNDRRLVETRLLTRAGLRATVRAVQQAIESGEFARAQTFLKSIGEHPDRGSIDPAIDATLQVLAAWGSRDDATVARVMKSLTAAQDGALRKLAEQLATIVAVPCAVEDRVINSLAPAPLGSIPNDAVQLWSEPLENSLTARLQSLIEEGSISALGTDGSASSGRLAVSIPTVDGALVLVNEGYVLRAYDAYSHLPRWTQFLGAANSPRSDLQAGDLAVVVATPECVLTLSGHALGSERSGGGRLVCLDVRTGQRKWDFAPDRFGDQAEMRDTFFYGAPTVVGETVVLLARKVTARQETVSTVVGIDLTTGVLAWITPVGAAPGIRPAGARPYTSPIADNGCVFVSTGAGTTACIEARDGRVRWIRRDSVPIRDLESALMPWQMGGLVVTQRGLIALAPGGNALQLLAADSGLELDSIPLGIGTAWESPHYFLTNRDRSVVYGIGEGIVAFQVDDLRAPIWQFKGTSGDEAIDSIPGLAGIRGRVQSGWLESGTDALIVPLLQHALLLNGDDGTTMLKIPCEGPANIVARHGVIAAATNGSLDVFMDGSRAKKILIAAIDQRPGDADAVLGLVEFALRVRDPALLRTATRAIDAALEGVRDDRARRARFVALLVGAAQSGLLGREGSDELFAAIVRSTAGADERASALVAQGDWLVASGRVVSAIAAWRSVLADPQAADATITQVVRGGSPIARSGAGAALLRLQQMASSPSAPSEATQPATSPPIGGTADELEAFARCNPCTAAAARAWLACAEMRMDKHPAHGAGDCGAAVSAAIASGSRVVTTTILDQCVTLLREFDLEITAAQLLDRCVMAGFDVPLNSLGGMDASRALLASSAAPAVESLPRALAAEANLDADTPITARLLRGVLTPLQGAGTSPAPHSRAYLVADRALTCLATPSLEQRWKLPLLGDLSAVFQLRDGVIVIEQRDRETLGAQWIDDRGDTRWQVDDLAAAVSEDGVVPERTECLVLCGRDDLAIVRVDGSVVMLSASDGQSRWRASRTVDEVACATSSETLVAIAGTRGGSDDRSSWLVALDQATGAVIEELRVPDDEPVRWLHVLGPGELAYGTPRGVGRWQLFGSAAGLQWLSLNPRLRGTVYGDPLGMHLLVGDATDRENILDWHSGTIEDGRFESTTLSDAENSKHWMRSGSVIVGWSRTGIDLFTLRGEAIGASRLHGIRNFQHVLAASGGLLAVEQNRDGANEPRESGARRAATGMLIHRLGWGDGGRIASPALDVEFSEGRIDRAQLLDGWILLGGSQLTHAIPLP